MTFHLSRKAITKMQASLVVVVVIIAVVGGAYAYYSTLTTAPMATSSATMATSANASLAMGPPIKIAFVPPLTGPAALTGKQLQDGIMFTYNELKADGQIPVKVDGQYRDIQFIWLDSKSDPATAVAAYNEGLVQDGADIIGWNWHSSIALAVYTLSTKYNKIDFGDVGETQALSSARLLDPNASRYYFKCWADPPSYASVFGPALTGVLAQAGYTPNPKVAALLLEDTDYGRAMGDALNASLTAQGWTVKYYDVFSLSPPETDFTPFISKYKDAGVTLVYQVSTGLPSMTAFMKQSYDANLTAIRASFGIGWFSTSEWYPALGPASDYVLSMDSNAITTPAQMAFASKFQAAYGYAPSAVVTGYWGHDLFSMLIAALNQAGTMNPETIRTTLLNMDYHGIFMNVHFTTNADPPLAYGPMEVIANTTYFHFPLMQWMHGNATAVYPPAEATGKFVVPPNMMPMGASTGEVVPIFAAIASAFVVTPVTPGKFSVLTYV